MKRSYILSLIVIVLISIVLIASFFAYSNLTNESKQKPFYVGLTYCGNSDNDLSTVRVSR
jgi:hypothetical protein